MTSPGQAPLRPAPERITKLSMRSIAAIVAVIVVAGSLIIYFGFIHSSSQSPPRPGQVASQVSEVRPGGQSQADLFVLASSRSHRKRNQHHPSPPPTGQTLQIGNGVSVTVAAGWKVEAQQPAASNNAAFVNIVHSSPPGAFVAFALGQVSGGTPTQILATSLQQYLSTQDGFSNPQEAGNVSTGSIGNGQVFDRFAAVAFAATIVSSQQSLPIEGAAYCLNNSSTGNSATVFIFTPQGGFKGQVVKDAKAMLSSMA